MARFAILCTGLWDVPRNEIITPESPEVEAENRPLPISGIYMVVQDEKVGTILFDTGIAEDYKETWPEYFRIEFSETRKWFTITDQLAQLDLKIEDIDQIIISHLHYDHCGNLKLFKNRDAGKNIIVAEAEAKEAFWGSSCALDAIDGAYFQPEFIMPGISYNMVKEDFDLSDDVHLFMQPGHTPCVIGMMVKTEKNGVYIFPSDACYSSYNYGPPCILPGLCVDPVSYRASIEHIRELQIKHDATVVFSHDVNDFQGYKIGQWYE